MKASASSRVYGDGIVGIHHATSGSLQPATIASTSSSVHGRSTRSPSRSSTPTSLGRGERSRPRAEPGFAGREPKRGLASRGEEEGGRRGETSFPPANEIGGVLLSRGLAPRVPSALAGLTSLFGM